MGRIGLSKEKQEGQQKIRNFFVKWKRIFSINGLSNRFEKGSKYSLNNFLIYAPRKGDSSGYTALSDESLLDLRKQFSALRSDLDKVICDIDDYLEK